VLLHHSHEPEHGQHDLSHDVGAVERDGRVIDPQHRLLLNDALGDRQQVAGVAGETIRVERQQGVAFIEQAQGGFELVAPGELRAVADIDEHDDRAQ
jgi:hypothetical protein